MSAEQALQRPLSVPGQLHAVEGRGQLAPTFRASSSRRTTARGRNPRRSGPACRSASTPTTSAGRRLQDQRHRFVLSGIYVAPKAGAAVRRSSRSRRAGRTTSSRAPISTATATAARFRPIARGTRSGDRRRRASGATPATLPAQATVDLRVSRRFPLGRRQASTRSSRCSICSTARTITEINNVFGTGAYPAQPAADVRQFTQAAAPRQIQLAVKVGF